MPSCSKSGILKLLNATLQTDLSKGKPFTCQGFNLLSQTSPFLGGMPCWTFWKHKAIPAAKSRDHFTREQMMGLPSGEKDEVRF